MRITPALLLASTCVGCSWNLTDHHLTDYPDVLLYHPLGRRFSEISGSEAVANVTRLSQALAAAQSPSEKAKALVERGLWNRARGDLDAAIGDFSAAIELTPDNWEAFFHRWQAHLKLGNNESAAADQAAGMQLRPEPFQKVWSESHSAGVI